MARIIISVSSLLLLHATLLASEAGGLSFLNIPTSALSASLGSTTTADLGRPSALIQNPANIWQFKRFAISFSDRSLLGGIQGIKYHNVFFGFRVKQLALGLGCLYYSVDNIEQYDDQAVYLGNFSFQNVAIPFGFSLKIKKSEKLPEGLPGISAICQKCNGFLFLHILIHYNEKL